MGFFDVGSWEEVLAVFKEGGSLENRWGWLEVLRRANEEDHLYALTDEPERDSWWLGKGYIGDFAVASGKLGLRNRENGNWISQEYVGGHYEYYRVCYAVKNRSSMFQPVNFITAAHERYYHTKFDFSEVDKVGAGYDVVGITTNFIPDPTVQSIGIGADLAAVTMGWPKFAIAMATGASFPETTDAGIDLALDLGGLLPVGGVAWDVASLVKNFGQNTRVYHVP